ncbi:MAG: 2-isopropylmalate synthase [Chitinispirillaceae bacterium]|nr:2-isopropylmalate synthase [Chitinispirillaceae bacterium]
MKDTVLIFDTTLRDGEQALIASLSVDQKLRIARQLARLNVDIIEAGFPVSSPGDFESVSTIAREVDGPVICGLARLVEKDILSCAKAVKPAKRPRIHIFIGTSAIHTEKKLRKSEDEILELVRVHVKLARKLCPDVEFSAEDAGRTGGDFLCRIVETAIEAGASTINIPDTVGYTVPEHFASIFDDIFNRVPNIDKAVISVHCHNDLGMATANSLTAVAHGARQIECAMNGIGERAGNAALEEVVMALKVRKDYFKLKINVDTREIMRTSKLVREICSMPVQPNKAVVGSNAFSHSSGIHQDGVLKAKKTYEIMTPQSVGLKDNRMNLTSRSGSHMVKSRLLSLGYSESDFDVDVFYLKFKELADKKGTVYDDDLITLMESKNNDDFKDRYVLEYLNVSSGRGTIPTATARVSFDGKSMQEASCGDGAVDAATKAIDRIIGYKITIENFHIDSITEGREAQGRVTVIARASEGVFTGTAASTDIVEASALAYMNVINKIARMKLFNRKLPVGE